MNTDDLGETIAITLISLLGLALFVWSWATSGAFIAALIMTAVGGFFGVLLLGPVVAGVAFLVATLVTLIRRV